MTVTHYLSCGCALTTEGRTWCPTCLDPPQKGECAFCHGTRGGTPGNGNIISGQVVCDYCTSVLIDMRNHGQERRYRT